MTNKHINTAGKTVHKTRHSRWWLLLAFWSICSATTAHAQWLTFDASNLAQSIVNSTNEVVETATTASHMLNNFKETVKIYEQGKKYFDALRSVNNLVRDARKVQQCVLMLGEMTDIYVNNFRKMLSDENFTAQELAAIASGYTLLLSEGSYLLDELKQLTTATTLRMNDYERMQLIDKVYRNVTRYRNLIYYYTRKTVSVSYLRGKAAGDSARVAALYGSQQERYY